MTRIVLYQRGHAPGNADALRGPRESNRTASDLRLGGARRVIFLDVDGVLNCYATFSRKRGGEIAIDADKVRLVTALAWRTNSHVVISSTWRKGRGAMARLRKWLTARGLPAHRIIGATPDLSEFVDHLWRAPCRGDEIAAWLAHHPVDSFVIFDDDADMGALEGRLIRTEFKDGLTPEHCRRAEALLTAGPSSVGRAGSAGAE